MERETENKGQSKMKKQVKISEMNKKQLQDRYNAIVSIRTFGYLTVEEDKEMKEKLIAICDRLASY
jgi:hypothetical protein